MRKRLYALAGAVIASAFFSVTTVKTISAEADTTPAVAAASSTAGSQPSAASSDANSAKQNTTEAVTNQASSSTGSSSASGTSSTQSTALSSNSSGSVTSTSKPSVTDTPSTSNASSSSVTTSSEGKTNTDTSTVETPQTQTTPKTDNTANSSTSSASSESSSTPQPVTDNTSSGGGGPGDSSTGTAKPQSQTKVDSTEVTVDKANYFDNTDANPDNNKAIVESAVNTPESVNKTDFYTDKYYHGENNSANDPSKNSNAINDANQNPNDGAHDLGAYILDEQGKDGDNATNDEKAATINTAFNLTYHDNDGHPVQPGDITLATGIDGHMTFKIDHDVWKYLVTGDTFTYQLPSGYKIVDTQPGQTGNIQNANSSDKNSTYGTYTVGTDGKITLTFFNPHTHDETDDNPVQSLEGQLSFKATFNDQVITNPGQQGDKLHLPGQTDQDILVIHPATDQSISKTGRPDKNLDPNNIIWSVYMNKNMQTMTNTTITEKFDENVTYDNAKKPVEIYAIQVDLKGKVIKNDDGSDKLGEKLVAGTDYTVDATGKVTFLKQITTPYELIYTTSINDAAKPKDTHGNIRTGDATLNNTVDQRDDEQGDNVLPASASVIAHYEGLFYKYDPAIATNDHPNDPDYDKLHHIYTWTVAYNHGTDTLNGNTALYTDVIGAPQTFVKDSFHMWVMEYDPNNADQPFKYTNQQVDPSLYTLTPNTDGSGFTVKFNDGFNLPVNMVYQTQIAQGSKVISTDVKDIVNTAQVTGYDNQTPKPVTTHSYNLIKDVENGGPDRGLKVATWKIHINESNYTMKDYVLTDTAALAGLSQPFDPRATMPNTTNQPKVLVQDVTKNNKELIEGTDYTLTATGDTSNNAQFVLKLIGDYATTSDTFTVEYKTVYDVARVKTPLPNTNFKFTNDATGTWTDVTTNNPVTDHADNHFEASHDEAYQGSKNGVYNPETKQIHWTVISNYNAEDYKSYQLLDPIYQKQNFVPGSVKVTQGSIAAQGYFIPGETDPKYYTVHAYKGHVDMATGDFVIEGIINADGSITPMTGTTSYQGFQNYQGSELYNLRDYKDATTEIVIDFGSDATPLPKPGDVTGTDSRVKLAYQVEYDTDVKGILVDNMYNNIALTAYPIDNDGKLSVHGQASTYQGQPYISKTGNYNQDSGSNRANWTVDINRSQSAITNAVFTDTPTINQRIDPSTIHIYGVVASDLNTMENVVKGGHTIIDPNGDGKRLLQQTKLTPDYNHELKQGVDYDVVLTHDTTTGQETLTIKFLHTISTAYVLKYQSKLYFSKDDQGQTVRFSNGATLNGDNVTPNQPGDHDDDDFFVTESSAKAIGYFYNLVLTKKTTDGQKLAGITFNLYEENANHARGALLRTGVTDENGVVTFKNIPGYHVDGVTPIEYFIQEVNPSDKYITPDDLRNGTRTISVGMLSGTKNDQDRLGNIWNHLGQATLTKTDEAGNILNGAHFKLEVLKNGKWGTYSDSKGKVYDDLVTGVDGEKANDGKIVVNGLLPAQYRFVETQAPADYILNESDPQTKEIIIPKSDGNNPFGNEQKIAFFDTQRNSKGTFELHKVGTDGKAIAGAKFDLYYLDAAKNSVYVTNTKSDENGLVRFTGLNAGWTYCVREATSPNGYYNPDANADIVSFTVNTNSADGLDNVKYTNPVDKTDHVINYTDHVVLTKVGNDNSKVVGATFVLKDASGKVIKTLTTDTNGKQTSNDVWTTDGNGQIVIDNLTAGDYTLQEVAAPAGYILNSMIQKFTISAKLDSTFYFTMTDYRGQIQVTKVDGDDTSKKLGGVTYTLTGNGSTQTATTDANGIATFKNLSSGDYTVVETQSLDGYIRDTKVYKFTISADVTSDDKSLYDLSATYKNYQNKVTFTKFLNSDKGTKGPNAVYELNGAGESKQFTTDVNGLITFTGLKTGSYTLTELVAPMGYATNNTPLTFTVDADGNISVASLSQVDYQGHAQLTKTGANGPLQDVKFDLLDADQKTVEQANLVTDANGVITTKDLKPGTYYFVEKQTLSGYILDTTPIKVVIDDRKGQNDAWLDDLAKATLTNVQNKLVFTKHNAKNDLLDGAVYELTNNTTKAVTKYTTVHGQITMTGLAAGSYTMSEFTAPFGYATNGTPLTFMVDDSGHISVTSLSQTDYQGHAQLTKTGVNGPLQGVTFDLLDADQKNVEQANLITDANGVITTKDLKPGTYYFVERKTSSGYILDATPQKVVVQDNKNQTASWLDDSAKTVLANVQNQLIFTKYNVKHELLDGAVYELTNNATKEAKQYTTLNGQFTMIGLAVGNYTLAEITAPTGYATNGISMTFAVNEDGQVSVASLSQIDYQGHAQLTKTGANGPLQGVKFDLLDGDQKTVEQANLITDANGMITTKDLKPGTYYFVEKQTLSGYILDATPIKVVVADRKGQNAMWLDDSANATLTNVQNKLVFTKYGTHVGNVLDGAEYTLVNTTTGEKPTFTFVNGQVSLSGLAAGAYTITEITAPDGYMLNPDVISFTVDANGLIDGKTELSLNQIDYQGYAFMRKVSADTKAPLAGAVFYVYDSDNVWKQTITTGTDGLIKTKFLPVGDYYFREMKAPDGYILNSNLVHFSIKKSNHDVALDEGTFENWLGAVKMTKYGQPDVTNVGTRVMLPGTKFALYYVVDDGSEELYGIDPSNEHNVYYFKAGEDTKGWTTVFTTNVNGQIFLQGLKPGNYYFKEVAHADGYILRDDTPDLQPELNKGMGSANFVNKPQGLEFSRVDGTSAVVDKNGHVTSAPDDRDFSSRLYFIIRPASDVESVTFAGDQTNYQGSMTFTKTNSKGDKLAGAVYQLLDSDKKTVEVTMDGKQVSQLTTDANGNFTITGLAPGTYYLKEITAPDGYLINDNVDETKFVIADTTRGGQSNVTASQIDYQGSIKLTKVAAEDGHVLANATFELLDADKNVIKTGLTTDANGTLTVTDLKPGTYYFKETVAPTGYQLSTELLKVVVLDHAIDKPVAVLAKFQDTQVPPVTPPTTPNIPNIPNTPTTPNVPNIPNTPTTPNVPNIPNVPTTPGQPNIPNVPTTPEVPNIPTTPTVPNVPVMPNVPNKPMTPTMPNQPARPAKPETPIVSAQNGSYAAVAVTPVASQKLVANGRPAGQPAKQEGHGVTGLPETGEKSASLLAMLGVVLLSVIAGFAYYVRKQEA
ncbi:LPXTG cell wall anchor domain-containing protein [Furfurilactobacillus rossiae]|uniref:SpaA isopeptide-forming pilin-related protein n=1 Tax=Furfurilactobacillus rossiae TaxID=231049 RepID=UPI001F3F26EE|nr:SpaA isopeptide-forming pilin-related protein [Furfurilactobacillus rossiae]MCF6166187.1 LPXTG cell wall anchor domain-containing protein [Furfurilactobacillus rossiae]